MSNVPLEHHKLELGELAIRQDCFTVGYGVIIWVQVSLLMISRVSLGHFAFLSGPTLAIRFLPSCDLSY